MNKPFANLILRFIKYLFQVRRHRFASKYIKFGEKILAKYADEVIVLSQAAYDYFKEIYNRQTTIIHNGISRPERKDAQIIKEKYGLENKQIVSVKASGTGRETIFGDVVVRVSDSFALAMHIDTDECNAAAITPGFIGEIID